LGSFIADFYCAEAGLVIEADGGVHEDRTERDAARDAHLAAAGVLVLRFTNEEILHCPRRVLLAVLCAAVPRIGGG